jgi:ribonucleoside-diphosphate reductase beta chain
MTKHKPLSVLNLNTHSDQLFFGACGHNVSRYDVVRYPVLQKLNDHMHSLFWKPSTVDMSSEHRSFQKMTKAEKFVFTANLKRQILLDSVQGRAPMLVFAPHCTDPTLENCISTWSFFETIHSESYTHILRANYPNPSEVVDDIPNIQSIADCATSIALAYDTFISNPTKRGLYLALMAANALESIRFYVSFACTFSFAQRTFVEGSAKIVKFIARDETQHMALTQHVLKLLPKDDPEFAIIAEECKPEALALFQEAARQEKEWAAYLFSEGPILGLSQEILEQYVDHLLSRRTHALGIAPAGTPRLPNPLPWMDHWLNADNVQMAPQEAESSYLSSTSLQNDLTEMDMKDLFGTD